MSSVESSSPKSTGIGLLSGGLDSILAICVLREQNIRIEAVAFITPFFGPDNAQKAVKILNVPLHLIDITEVHLEMLKQPKHGYGSGMNPCIDCHALMFREAGKLMQQWGADFLFSGEVLGERPMSQNKQSLRVVARDSGFEEYIIRPLSARLLPVTRPEQEGKVDREQLLDIQGRSRKRQIELAKHYGISEFPEPAGGCRLTEPNFSKRLKDLMTQHKDFSVTEIELLKVGRHFRLHDQIKFIVGRNEQENEKIESLKKESDILIFPNDVPGPAGLIPVSLKDIPNKEEIIGLAASICARYSDAPANTPVSISIVARDGTQKVSVRACSEEITAQIII
jgi:tRNA U34 2-thiouridine synthase MnmA/TrmU